MPRRSGDVSLSHAGAEAANIMGNWHLAFDGRVGGDTQPIHWPPGENNPAPVPGPWPVPKPPKLPNRQGPVIVAGIVAAALVIGSISAALAFGEQHKGPLAGIFTVPSKPIATDTPVPTATPAPIATATPVPTNAPTAQPTLPADFQSYSASDGTWSMDYPNGATTQTGSLSVQGIGVPYVSFAFGQGDEVAVYESPIAVPASAAPAVIDAIANDIGASNVTTVQAPTPVTIGANSWTEGIYDGTVNGQDLELSVLYAPHNSKGYAIASSAPADTYLSDSSQYFTPMQISFTFSG
jgi:hypothetical protein